MECRHPNRIEDTMYHTDDSGAIRRFPATEADLAWAEKDARERSEERDIEEFEAWMESLDPQSFRRATQAVDTLRDIFARCHPSGPGMFQLIRWLGDCEH